MTAYLRSGWRRRKRRTLLKTRILIDTAALPQDLREFVGDQRRELLRPVWIQMNIGHEELVLPRQLSRDVQYTNVLHPANVVNDCVLLFKCFAYSVMRQEDIL